VHPYALDLLRSLDLPNEGLRSKSWDEFAQAGAPEMDFVITVCDPAAGEACPVWPGKPMTAHWGVPDPAVTESEMLQSQVFGGAFRTLENRIRIFTSLQPEKLDRLSLKRRLHEIGRVDADQPAGTASAS
jgi:arsenate reductase